MALLIALSYINSFGCVKAHTKNLKKSIDNQVLLSYTLVCGK